MAYGKAVATALATTFALSGISQASGFPEKPVNLVLPTSPGGATDVGARTYGPHLAKCLGDNASVVVVNKPGADGVIAFTEVAQTSPDGYTISTLNMPNLITTVISKEDERRYNIESFDYLGNLVGSHSTFWVMKDSPFNSLDELVAAAKEKRLKVGVGTRGSDDHLVFLRFAKMAEIEMDYIPFGDEANVRNALMGGQIDIIGMSHTAGSTFPQVRALGTASAERTEATPDTPTFVEQGYDLVAGSMHVLGAPKGLPDDVLQKLRGCVDAVAASTEFQDEAKTRNITLKALDAAGVEQAIRDEDVVLREIWETSPWRAE